MQILRLLISFCLAAAAVATNAEGKTWLAAKAKEAGVVATGSGLM